MAQIGRVQVRDGGGLEMIAIGRIRSGSGISAFFASLAATASDPTRGYGNSASAVDVTTGTSTCTVTGGVAPYTYLWSQVGSSGNVWSITQDALATTAFTGEAIDPSNGDAASFKCTVTDANGDSIDSNTITGNVINLGGGL